MSNQASPAVTVIEEPRVYLLARQTIDEGALNQFMADEEISWSTDTEVAAEKLVEVAGRVCYMSYAKPRPGGNEAYIDHILESRHGSVTEHAVWTVLITGISRSLSHELVRHRLAAYCLSGDTHIVSGAKFGKTYKRFPKSPRTWTIEKLFAMQNDPRRRHAFKLVKLRCFDGKEFVQTGIRAVSCSGEKDLVAVRLADGKVIKCSEDHRFLTRDGWQPVRKLAPAVELATNGLPAVRLNKDWLDQRYNRDNALLSEIAQEVGCSTHTVRKYLRLYSIQKSHGKGMVGRTPPNKGTRYTTGYRHSARVRRLLAEQKRGEKNPMWRGDAASEQAGRYRAQKLFPQQPCEKCSNPAGHRHHKDENTKNNTPENIQFLCNSCHRYEHLAAQGVERYLTVKWVPIVSITPVGRGMTYDIEVDHPQHNFVANGFVTHNSQLSQRYVDESQARFVVPAVIAASPTLRTVWENAVQKAQEAYLQLVDGLLQELGPKLLQCRHCEGKGSILFPGYNEPYPCGHCHCSGKDDTIEARTALRKECRQAARSVLPNATETKITVTMNTRAWRHFLEMRCSRHADREIRVLAYKVYQLLKKESAHLFGDYQEVELPDGTKELTTNYRKV